MIKEKLHILMLEDNSLDAELNKEQLLLLEEYNCIVKIIMDKAEFIKEITSSAPPDLILCDYNLPQYNGMEALKDLKSLKLMIPFIFVTGTMQEEIAADAIKAGAWDYVVKDRLFRLPLAVRGVLQLKKEKEIAVEADRKTQRLIKGIEETFTQVIVLDNDFLIDYVNLNFTKVTGLQHDEVVGKSFLSIIPDENQKFRNRIHTILKGKEVYKGDEKIIQYNGVTSWEHISITPIRNVDGEVRSYILMIEDITKQKQVEQELKKSLEDLHQLNKELEISKKKAEESDNLKTAFLANLSHEIRTPMNGILGFANLLKEDNMEPELIEKYIYIIEDSGNRMLKLIEDLVDISKIEANQVEIRPEETNLNRLFDDIFNFFEPQASYKKILFTYNKGLNDSDSCILIDKLKLEQILSNLINNALKFTRDGSIHFNYILENDQLIFSVKDTGIGIQHGMEKVIFERFRQGDNNYLKEAEGSGLGLSITKSFVELMGGKIWVESEYGKGSVFFVSMPFESLSKVSDKKNSKTEHAFEKNITVLIAEDDEVSYLYLEQVLKNDNFKILHARNGVQAVQLLKEHPEINIVLMDLKMPLMNGIDVINEIKKKGTKIPIIVQSAYASDLDVQKALDAGCNDYIIKPIKKDLLLKKIAQAISEHIK